MIKAFKFKFIIFLVVATALASYINQHIANYDMRFYQGKDNGYSIRFESIGVLSSFYFTLMPNKIDLRNAITGLAVGFVVGVIGYFSHMNAVPDPYLGIAYYIICCAMFILIFSILKRFKKVKESNA